MFADNTKRCSCCTFFRRKFYAANREQEIAKVIAHRQVRKSVIKDYDLRQKVDHDYSTGQIRELLCYNCNLAIGNVQENIKIVKKLLKYLIKHAVKE